MKRENERRHIILSIGAISVQIFVAAIVLEVSLHTAAYISPQIAAVLFPTDNTPIIPDSDLISRGNPRHPEHDANGFRNVSVRSQADIVSIGDSHTYGTNVEFNRIWPRLLEELTSCRLYNMSLGGYGPLQYVLLSESALRLKPRLILVGIYFGNDLYDNWELYRRHPQRYPVPERLAQPAVELERESPLSRDVEDFFRMGRGAGDTPNVNSGWSLKRFLDQSSSLWGFVQAISRATERSVLSHSFQTAVSALSPKQLEYASIFEGEEWRTIFTSRYRGAAENEDDPRIRVGYWLTEWSVQRISQLAERNGIRSIFVLLPTKESVFSGKVRDAEKHRYFGKLVRDERLHRKRLIKFMEQFGIAYVDMAPLLSASVAQPYFENADGHPNMIGHEAIAERLAKETGVCG